MSETEPRVEPNRATHTHTHHTFSHTPAKCLQLYAVTPSTISSSATENLFINDLLLVTDTVKALELTIRSIGAERNKSTIKEIRKRIVEKIANNSTASFDTTRKITDIELAYKAVHELEKSRMKNDERRFHVMVVGRRDAKSKETMLNDAIAALDHQDNQQADPISVTQNFVDAYPNDPDAYHLYGLARRHKSPTEAIVALTKATSMMETPPSFFYSNLGSVQMDADLRSEAATR